MASPKMKAAVLESYGERFNYTDVPRPMPQAGQVLVKVGASGVNPLDTKIRSGKAAHARHPLPAILGLDLAGTVVEVGPDVADFKRDDEVYGMTGGVGGVPGSLAEYAVADAALLAIKPSNLTMRQAAALPLAFITAWEGLVDRAKVSPGQNVLIQGGAGGVGHIAIQIAKAFGADVYATGSKRDHEFVSSLGAIPIDRDQTVDAYVSGYTNGKGFDLVYDTVGGAVLDQSFAAVKKFGHVVSALGWGTHALAPLSFKAGTYSGVFTLLPILSGEGKEHHSAILREATALVEAEKVLPNVDPTHFTLETVAAAHAAVEGRSSRGKVVITVDRAQPVF